jgi:OOP family OmpA-OmpF porin
MKRLLPFATLCCLLGAPAATAGDFYVGGALGQTSFDVADEAARFSVDDWGWKLFGGYRVKRWLAVEVAYMDAGQLDETVDGVRVQGEAQAATASVVGIWAFTPRAELFARAGAAGWSSETSLTEDSTPEVRDESGTDFFWGLGFAYDFTERFGLRFELEYFAFQNEDVRFGSIGLRYTF